jgi:hypothetical protein
MRLLLFIKVAASLLGLVVFGILPVYAQAEIDPDHFDSPTTKPLEKGKPDTTPEAAPVQYNATFTLPYSVQCNGKNLAPGTYSLSVRHDGKQGKATLHREDQAIEVVGVVQKQPHNHRNTAVIVEVSEKSRRLSAIQMTQADLVLDPDTPGNKPKQVDRLPLKEALQKNSQNKTPHLQ